MHSGLVHTWTIGNTGFHPIIIDHIFGWRWEDATQWKAALPTTDTHLGIRWDISLLVTIHDAKKVWVAKLH
jgi:hypothetical protein